MISIAQSLERDMHDFGLFGVIAMQRIGCFGHEYMNTMPGEQISSLCASQSQGEMLALVFKAHVIANVDGSHPTSLHRFSIGEAAPRLPGPTMLPKGLASGKWLWSTPVSGREAG